MTRNPVLKEVIEALQDLVDRQSLPSKAIATAETLIKRLTSPVRVAVMGPPGAGKSHLVNVLCGAKLLPPDVRLPTTDIRYAEAPRLRVTLPDGSRRDLPELDVEAAAKTEPSLVEIRAPLEMLQRISLLELVTDGSAEELKAAANWAARRAEMALWVTPDFSVPERRIWNDMPESLKTNAFLVMSQLDRQSYERQELIQRMTHATTGGEFLGMYPVTALQVSVAVEADVADIAPAMEVSGCTALMEALLARLDLGEQADIDAAEYFLLRYGETPPEKLAAAAKRQQDAQFSRRPGEAGSGRSPSQRLRRAMLPTSRNLSDLLRRPSLPHDPEPSRGRERRPVVSRQISELLPVSDGRRTGASKPLDLDLPQGAGATSSAAGTNRLHAAEAETTAQIPPARPGALGEALQALRSSAAEMLTGLEEAEEPSVDILSRCADAIEVLSGLSFGTEELEDAVAEAADVVLLLQVERSEMAAEDAVCALLQLKRDFEVVSAA